MNFQPLIPQGGLPGWVVLNATLERQTEVFNSSPIIQRDTAYFEENIAKILTPEQLVSDRRLLRVALGAFGLLDDIDNRAFIRTILDEGTVRDDALANRLSDDRYKQLADAFAFADRPVPRTQLSTFPGEIVAAFRRQEFEVAVGEQDEALRLAMNTQRELPDILSDSNDDDTIWYRIMGTPPLRKVFEVALGLPDTFAQRDIDRQLETFKEQFDRQLDVGALADLAQEDQLEVLIRRYLLRDQVAAIEVQSSNAIALMLLQSPPRL